MSALWGSARHALAYHFSCRRGPQMSRPRYHDAPPSTGHSPWDHVVVGALLYGPRSEGGCGVEPGDDLDDELAEWALDRDAKPSDRVVDVLAELRMLLEQHGLSARPTCPEPSEFYRFRHPDGSLSGLRLRRQRLIPQDADSSG